MLKTGISKVMWSLIKKYKTKSAATAEARHNDFFKTTKLWLFIEDKWAKKMSSITSRLSERMLICLLALFVVLAGGACFYSISKSFSNATSLDIKIIRITKPVDAFEKSFGTIGRPLPSSRNEFKRVIDFKMYLDSLGRSPTGRTVYDSIDKYRPGLMDSLIFIENYYKSNFKD